jgi:hypothetical protein
VPARESCSLYAGMVMVTNGVSVSILFFLSSWFMRKTRSQNTAKYREMKYVVQRRMVVAMFI